MTVAKYNAPDYTDAAQTAAIYKAYIDGGMSVLHAVAGDFAPHAQDTPNMTVAVDAGKIIAADGTLTDQAAQNTGTITAPASNPRIDRVILNPSTGAVSVVTGTEAASPTAPSITAGYLPICQIALTTSTTAITNSMITDERTALRPFVQTGTGGENLRMLRGHIHSTGSVNSGDGFSVVRNSTGYYTITFDTSFGGLPAVSASLLGLGFATISGIAVNAVEVKLYTTAEVLADGSFFFTAIGAV